MSHLVLLLCIEALPLSKLLQDKEGKPGWHASESIASVVQSTLQSDLAVGHKVAKKEVLLQSGELLSLVAYTCESWHCP